jgi:hypothetical protein
MSNIDIFIVGNDTIDKMNELSSSVSLEDTNSSEMASIISRLKTSVDRFHTYSNIGTIKKIFTFTTDIEIEANIKIAHIEFETLLKDGSFILSQLQNQYDSFDALYIDLKKIYDTFTSDILLIEDFMRDNELSTYEAQRLVRKKNDILSAQILAKTNAIQYDLCKANIGILIDKFISIEKVLQPALEQNVKFSKSQFNRIF